ncbi:sensor histidine kinase [Paenibacillus sp. GCM10023252]|uniref:sensor histidine kinase n=1 Tax=Paenibacillus sp. GCM10023252 TaxID=3252649 RepID=UPI00360E8E81
MLLFVVVIAPLVFFLYYNNYYARNVVEQQVTDSYETMLSNFVNQSDEIMEAAEKYLINIQQQELDVNAMDLTFTDHTNYTLSKVRVYNKFSMNLSYMNGIDSLMLYSIKNNEAVLSTSHTDYQSKLDAATKLMNERSLSAPIPQRGQLGTTFLNINGKHYMIRLYTASSTLILGAWIDLDMLVASLNADNSAILSNEGTVLANRGLSGEQLEWMKEYLSSTGSRPSELETRVLLHDRDHLLFMKTSASQDLRYVIMIPSKQILLSLSFFQKVILVIPAAILLILGLYAAFMQRMLIRPMKYIMSGMRRLSQGNLDTRLELSSSTEFNYMMTTFNNMAEETKSLKLYIYEEKLRVQQAEMKQLQMQINPHFYANSLNIINGMAQLGEYSSVQNMTRLLAAYFRFVTTSSRPTISLQEEIEHIQNYLQIQKYRYPTTLVFEVDVHDELLHVLLPPLTIQPFVENAIIHGYQKKINPFIIRLRSELPSGLSLEEADSFEIIIEDNGVGVSSQQLEQLTRSAQLPGTDNQHLGIWNVQRRLKLSYGEENVLILFEDVPEGGLRIRMKLPLTAKKIKLNEEEKCFL